MANFLQMLPGFYFKLEEEHALPLACSVSLSLLIPSTNGIWQMPLRIGSPDRNIQTTSKGCQLIYLSGMNVACAQERTVGAANKIII